MSWSTFLLCVLNWKATKVAATASSKKDERLMIVGVMLLKLSLRPLSDWAVVLEKSRTWWMVMLREVEHV